MDSSGVIISLVVLLYTISIVVPPATSLYAYKKCTVGDLDGAVCPPNSYCSQRSVDDKEGDCVCKHSHILNALHTNDEDYCLMDYTTIQTPEEESSHKGMASATMSEAPHHHIIGGILIPLVLVSAFVSGAYFVVRYRVLQRFRDRIMGRRRRRPTYQDVMLGTEFDPPLI